MGETADLRTRLQTITQAQQEQAARQFTVTTTVSPGNGAATTVVSTTPPLSASFTASASIPSLGQGPRAPILQGQGLTTPPTPITTLLQPEVTPSYKLNRDVHTIPALWRLWTVGIGGAPSVEELDQRYGSAWRQTPSERQYYSMRKTLIDEIKERTLKDGDGDPGRVVRAMEESRLSVQLIMD